MKSKILCILHRSPPSHGAAKVGDLIASSKKFNERFNCRYITIKSSKTISEIGKINFKKINSFVVLYINIFWELLVFRPDKIYFTSSISGVAFYRDLLVSTLWKIFKLFKPVEVYYHYHTKGVDDFVSTSSLNLVLTNFFIKDTNIILLSPILKDDFSKIKRYKKFLFLPNGVEDTLFECDFDSYINKKFLQKNDTIEVLYLSNMIKSKGYFEVLKLANSIKKKYVHFNFAGGWQNDIDKKEFFEYIKNNKLEEFVTFYGFVSGQEKKALFKKAHIFIFPTRYENEAFPLSILEAFSYGIPIISTNEGSIPNIVDEKSGIVLKDTSVLSRIFDETLNSLINIETARYCRKRFVNNFSLEQFEKNLLKIFEK